jgi:hypothetical protein
VRKTGNCTKSCQHAHEAVHEAHDFSAVQQCYNTKMGQYIHRTSVTSGLTTKSCKQCVLLATGPMIFACRACAKKGYGRKGSLHTFKHHHVLCALCCCTSDCQCVLLHVLRHSSPHMHLAAAVDVMLLETLSVSCSFPQEAWATGGAAWCEGINSIINFTVGCCCCCGQTRNP